MVDILHRIGVRSEPQTVYDKLATIEGLAEWWTTDTRGENVPDGTIEFRFGDRGQIDMKVLQLDPQRHVLWEVVGGPKEWIGSKVGFELQPDEDFTFVKFKHEGWQRPSEFMHHCSTKWAMFLVSIKSLIEDGEGAPYPRDVHITNKGD